MVSFFFLNPKLIFINHVSFLYELCHMLFYNTLDNNDNMLFGGKLSMHSG